MLGTIHPVFRCGPPFTAVGLLLLLALSFPVSSCDPSLLCLAVLAMAAWFGDRRSGRRRRDEEAQAQLASIVEWSEDAIIGKDLDGIIFSWNPAAERLYGYSSAEVHGRSIALLIPPDRPEELPDIMARIRRGERIPPFETERLRKDGQRIAVSVSVSPIKDPSGRVIGASAIARDISKPRREEAALREREEMIRLLLESTGEGIYGLDRHGLCTFCNPASLRMLGYDNAHALLDKNLHDLTHHTRTDGTPYPFEDCRVLQALWRKENVHVDDEIFWRADGMSFPVEYWSYPVRRNSDVVGLVVTFVDRSERRRAEEALRASEARFRQLAENIDGVVWLVDLHRGAIMYVSPTYEKVWGRSCASLYEAPRSFLESVHPEDRDWMAKTVFGPRREEGFKVAFRIVRPDGAIRWLSVRGVPIRDEQGQAYRLAGITVDITALKQGEERLAYQAQLLNDVNDAIISADRQMRITSWNRAAERMYGWQAEEVFGKDIRQVVPVKLAHTTREDVLREVLEKGSWRGEASHWSRDGREMIVLWSIAVIRDLSGDIIGTVAINRDITELKASQRLALQAERLAAIGQVVATIVHESGNALQGSQACLERLALRVQGQSELLGLVDRAQKEQDRLQRLYEDIRGYAAPIRLEPSQCRMDEVWRAAWFQLREGTAGRQVRFSEETVGVDLDCFLDRFRLEQVFRNIFDNALAACSDPVQISVHCAEAAIDEHPAVRVVVRDNGPGLSAEDRLRMFEPFYTTKSKGTGLGLAISKRLVEAHGGQITAAAGAERGTEIIVTIPRRIS